MYIHIYIYIHIHIYIQMYMCINTYKYIYRRGIERTRDEDTDNIFIYERDFRFKGNFLLKWYPVKSLGLGTACVCVRVRVCVCERVRMRACMRSCVFLSVYFWVGGCMYFVLVGMLCEA